MHDCKLPAKLGLQIRKDSHISIIFCVQMSNINKYSSYGWFQTRSVKFLKFFQCIFQNLSSHLNIVKYNFIGSFPLSSRRVVILYYFSEKLVLGVTVFVILLIKRSHTKSWMRKYFKQFFNVCEVTQQITFLEKNFRWIFLSLYLSLLFFILFGSQVIDKINETS